MGFGRYTRFGINALQVVLSARVLFPPETPDMEWAGACYDVVELYRLGN